MTQKSHDCPACGSTKTIPAMPNGKIPTRRRREKSESDDCQHETDSAERLCKACQQRFKLEKDQEKTEG